DPDRAVRTVEDVAPVTVAVHPTAHDVGRRGVAVGDVLPGRGGVTGGLGPVHERAAVPSGVAEVVVRGHVLAVAASGGAEPLVGGDLAAASRPALLVGERGDLVLPRGDLVGGRGRRAPAGFTVRIAVRRRDSRR